MADHTLAAPKHEQFALLCPAVEIETAQLGLAASAVDLETAYWFPGLQATCKPGRLNRSGSRNGPCS